MNKLLYSNLFGYRVARHVLFFLLTVSLFTVILYMQNDGRSLLQSWKLTMVNAIFFFGYAYLTIFLLIPEFLLTRKIAWFLVLFVLVGVALSALKLVVSDYIFYSSLSPENIDRTGMMNLRFMIVNTKDMSFIVALFCVAKYLKDSVYSERLRNKLESQNKEAQGKLLQSQFDPHFMFNTINNLYALSLLDPLKTRDVIDRMKIVLHYIIDESQKQLVTLNDEILLVENYVQLEKLRYGKRLKVELISEGNLMRMKIPPLVLFVLVENCFKHGSSLDAGRPWIKILVKSEPGKIALSTENSKPSSAVKKKHNLLKGYGFRNLKKRLELIYSTDGYKLDINDFGDHFKVHLTLNKEIESREKTYR